MDNIRKIITKKEQQLNNTHEQVSSYLREDIDDKNEHGRITRCAAVITFEDGYTSYTTVGEYLELTGCVSILQNYIHEANYGYVHDSEDD